MSVSSEQVPVAHPFPRGVRVAPDFFDADGLQLLTVHDSSAHLVAEVRVASVVSMVGVERLLSDWLDMIDPTIALTVEAAADTPPATPHRPPSRLRPPLRLA